MKKELLDEIGNIYNEQLLRKDKYGRIEYISKDAILENILKDYENRIIDAEKIYACYGSYINYYGNFVNLNYDAINFSYRIYANLEKGPKSAIKVPRLFCPLYEMGKDILIIRSSFPDLAFNRMRLDYFKDSINQGQEYAKQKVLEKYHK